MTATTVRTAIWRSDDLFVVEGIPAHVCAPCAEQYYDEDVSEALRRLAEDGFPASEATKQIVVPVFSLERRIVRSTQVPAEDTFVD